MATATKLLYVALAVLMADSITELALITSMVGWLHKTAGGDWLVNYNGGQFLLHGKPAGLLLNQGHTSNGASGTAFIPVGIGGILALFLRNRQLKRNGSLHGFTNFFYTTWLWFTLVSAIFSLAAFVFCFVVVYSHTGQHIDIAKAASLNDRPYPNYKAYPLLQWAPQNWFPAVLELPLASSSVRSDIESHVTMMKVWQWNLIPMVILGFLVFVLAFMDRIRQRQRENHAMGQERLAKRQTQYHNV